MYMLLALYFKRDAFFSSCFVFSSWVRFDARPKEHKSFLDNAETNPPFIKEAIERAYLKSAIETRMERCENLQLYSFFYIKNFIPEHPITELPGLLYLNWTILCLLRRTIACFQMAVFV